MNEEETTNQKTEEATAGTCANKVDNLVQKDKPNKIKIIQYYLYKSGKGSKLLILEKTKSLISIQSLFGIV